MSNPQSEESHAEALAHQAIHRICKREYRPFLPPATRAALAAQEIAESRARIIKEKLRWDLTR